MSKIKQQRQITATVVVQTRCDNCGKLADGDEPKGWHHFSASHDDWGNDSLESWENFDACSAACWIAVVRKVVADYGDGHMHPTLTLDGMDYAFARDLLAMVDRNARQGA